MVLTNQGSNSCYMPASSWSNRRGNTLEMHISSFQNCGVTLPRIPIHSKGDLWDNLESSDDLYHHLHHEGKKVAGFQKPKYSPYIPVRFRNDWKRKKIRGKSTSIVWKPYSLGSNAKLNDFLLSDAILFFHSHLQPHTHTTQVLPRFG